MKLYLAPQRLLIAALIALSIVSVVGPNVVLALYACFVLGVGAKLLWRPGEPPILLFIFLYQWIQASIGLFYGNFLGLPIDAVSKYSGQQERAVFLLLTGLLVLAVAIRLAAGPVIHNLLPRVQAVVGARPLRFWLWTFAGAWVLSAACRWIAPMAGGLYQPLLTLSNVKWAAFVLLTLATFAVPGRSKVIWLAVFGFEFALSIGGFFSNFKEVFIYALIGLGGSGVRFRAKVILPAAVLVGGLLLLGIVWTAVKVRYREFVSEDTNQQVVLVDYRDRIAEIGRLVSQLDEQDLSHAAEAMTRRLMYFQYFGVVLNRVPSVMPYSNGKIWGDAVLRSFMPRLVFPDKSAINDSVLTNRYTGLGLASYKQGTSISMGYMTDAYIDFGPLLMFVPIGGLGLFLGYFYRWLTARPGVGSVEGAVLAPFGLMPAMLLETSILKLIPGLGLTLIACWVFLNVPYRKPFGLRRSQMTHRNAGRSIYRAGK